MYGSRQEGSARETTVWKSVSARIVARVLEKCPSARSLAVHRDRWSEFNNLTKNPSGIWQRRSKREKRLEQVSDGSLRSTSAVRWRSLLSASAFGDGGVKSSCCLSGRISASRTQCECALNAGWSRIKKIRGLITNAWEFIWGLGGGKGAWK